MIDDNIYIFEEEILPKLNETLKSLATLQNHADEALTGIKKAHAIYNNATMPLYIKITSGYTSASYYKRNNRRMI